jgi:hypothetical protein
MPQGPAANVPPVANAGEDLIVYVPTLYARLDGSKSTDLNNDIRTYQWKQISGKDVVSLIVGNPDVKVAEVFFISEGVYQFELTVTDMANFYSRDTVQVTVVDNFAPGVAPSFVESCDSLVLASSESRIIISSAATVTQGYTEYWLYSGYTFRQISGPTNANIVYTNGAGSNAVAVGGLARGTYVFGVEVNRNGLKAYDTTVVRVIDDTASGKEYIFESTWQLDGGGYSGAMASTPSRPEIFLMRDQSIKKFKLWLKIHNSNDWVEVPELNYFDDQETYFTTDQCGKSMTVSYWGSKYSEYIGKKVQMKVSVP